MHKVALAILENVARECRTSVRQMSDVKSCVRRGGAAT